MSVDWLACFALLLSVVPVVQAMSQPREELVSTATGGARHDEPSMQDYSSSAQTRNSENVLVLWNSPDLAGEYLQHFERNRDRAQVLDGRY